MTLCLMGFMGCGKSTVGALVADRVRAPFRDLDAEVEMALGIPIPEVFASQGEAAFRRAEAALLPGALAAAGVLALGGGTPLADDCWELIASRSVTVWLDAPLEELLARVHSGAGRPLALGGDTESLGKLFRSRLARYAQAQHRVDAGRPLDQVVEEVVGLWSQ